MSGGRVSKPQARQRVSGIETGIGQRSPGHIAWIRHHLLHENGVSLLQKGGAARGLTELRGVVGRGPEPYTTSMADRTEQGRAGRARAEHGSGAGQGSVAHEPEPHVI